MEFLKKYLPKDKELEDMSSYEKDVIRLGEVLTRLSERGITLDQLEKIANGEAWVSEWDTLSNAKSYFLIGYNNSTNSFMEMHFDLHSELFYFRNGDYPTHKTNIMTFNGKTDVPVPKVD